MLLLGFFVLILISGSGLSSFVLLSLHSFVTVTVPVVLLSLKSYTPSELTSEFPSKPPSPLLSLSTFSASPLPFPSLAILSVPLPVVLLLSLLSAAITVSHVSQLVQASLPAPTSPTFSPPATSSAAITSIIDIIFNPSHSCFFFFPIFSVLIFLSVTFSFLTSSIIVSILLFSSAFFSILHFCLFFYFFQIPAGTVSSSRLHLHLI